MDVTTEDVEMSNEMRGLNSNNVFDLSEARERREEKKSRERFKNYLQVLSQEELEIEIKSFFLSLESHPFSKNKAQMGQVLLEELAGRISDSPLKMNSINGMKNAITKKIKGFDLGLS